MKILIASTSESFSNGASKCLMEMVQHLEQRGHNVVVIIPNHGTMEDELERCGICYRMFRERRAWTIVGHVNIEVVAKRITNLYTINNLRKFIRTEDFDIVHINAVTAYTVAAAALDENKPVVWHIREFLEEDLNIHFAWKKWSYEMINKATEIVAISNSVKESWESRLKRNITVINDGLPIEQYRIDHKENDGIINVILYGRITEGKGQLFYVKGIKNSLSRINREVRFYYAGIAQDKEYFKLIEDYVDNNNLEDYVEYLGEVHDVKKMLGKMHISCICSKAEGFGRVTAESILARCLVIGANSGATPDILEEGQNGILYESGSEKDFSDKLVNLINNYETYIPKIETNQRVICDKYSIINEIDKIENLYYKALNQKDE